MMKFFEMFEATFDFFDGLAWRERLLLFLSVGAGLYFLLDVALIFPGKKALHELQLDIKIVEEKHRKVSDEYAIYERFSERDPDSIIKEQLEQLKQKSQFLKKEIRTLSAVVVSENEISNVLRDIAIKAQSVKLITLRVLPSSAISSNTIYSEAALPEAMLSKTPLSKTGRSQTVPPHKKVLNSMHDQGGLPPALPDVNALSVRHVQLDIEADYFSTLQFVASLEKLPWPLSWQSLEYKVLQYPLAKSTLKISFLSLDEDL